MMKKSRWITEQWPKMLRGVFLIGIFVCILRVFEIITTYEAIQLLFVGSLVLVTAVYAGETAKLSKSAKEQAENSEKMAKEMEEQRHELNRPIIIFILERSSYSIGLRLRNIGGGPAINPYLVIRTDNNALFDTFDPIEVNDISSYFSEFNLISLKNESFWLIANYQNLYGDCYKSVQRLHWLDGNAKKEALLIEKISMKEYKEGKNDKS